MPIQCWTVMLWFHFNRHGRHAAATDEPGQRDRGGRERSGLSAIPDLVGFWSTPPLLFRPAESLQVETVPVVELDAFLFEQALLEGIAAIAG